MLKKISLLLMIPVFVLSYSNQSLATGAADAKAPSVVANPGTKETADTAKKDNNSGSQVGQMISQGFMMAGVKAAAACGKSNPGACAIAPVMFALSALAGKQSKANKKTAGQAAYAGYDTDGSGNYGYGDFAYDPYGNGSAADGALDGGPGGPGNGLIKTGDLEAYKKSLAQLTSKNGINGFKFDPKKGVIITPDGKQIPVEQFDSHEGMKKAGMTDAQIKATMDKANKLEQEALAKVGGITGLSEDGGGAPGGTLAGSGAGDDELGGASGHGSVGKLNNRDPANSKLAAGLSKDFNGEPIGVAQDGLFLMMTRRYKVKEKQDSFFTDAELIQK